MTNDKAKEFLKNEGKKMICEAVGHDERVFKVNNNNTFEIHCKRCNENLKTIKSFY